MFMPVENESDYTFGMEKEDVHKELAKHSTSGSEWKEIADYSAGEEPRHFTAKNWTGDILNSLKGMETEFSPADYVLIQREFAEKDYMYSVQAYPRRQRD